MKTKGFRILMLIIMLMCISPAVYAQGPAHANQSKKAVYLTQKNCKAKYVKPKVQKPKPKEDKRAKEKVKPVNPKRQIRVESVSLNKTNLTLSAGSWERLVATLNPSNASIKKIFWTSSDPFVVSVNPSGKVTGLRQGTAEIYVFTYDGFKSAKCTVTVTSGKAPADESEIYLNKSSLTLHDGSSERLQVYWSDTRETAREIRWYSNDQEVATVDQHGLVTAKDPGTTTIFAVTPNGALASCTVTVTSSDTDTDVSSITIDKTTSEIVITEGTTKRLTYTVKPDDADDYSVTWETRNSDIVSVDQDGDITGENDGYTYIRVVTSDGIASEWCKVRVIASGDWEDVSDVYLNLANTTIPVGFSDNLKYRLSPSDASDQQVRWTSSNTSVATVDVWGTVRAKSAGTTTITARAYDGSETASCVVTVTNEISKPSNGILMNKIMSTLYEDEKDYPQVVMFPAETRITSVSWKSSDTSVATVSSSGVVTGVNNGTAVITARTSDNKTASYVVIVVDR